MAAPDCPPPLRSTTQLRTNAIPPPPLTKNPRFFQKRNCPTAITYVVRMVSPDTVVDGTHMSSPPMSARLFSDTPIFARKLPAER